ncbi:MAG: Ig-like domain-containing protein [Deltaproteobacteria bacterium]|nr:Ig-like domain-containing protein [Deltaproteobacteria bacterium]
MNRTLPFMFAVMALTPISAAVADNQRNYADAPSNPFVTPWSRPQAGYVIQDPGLPVLEGDAVHAAPNFSNVIYLNNCKAGGGCKINPGSNNATVLVPTSTIPDQQSVVQPFAYSDAVWQEVVACVKRSYAPFAVTVVDERPASGNYHMAIVAGVPQDVQMQQGVGGVSPFACGYIPNAVSFSFANVYGGSVDDICWTVAQETAHSWGLDHKFDNRDPMTYLSSGPSLKVFQNTEGACGEFSARDCQCGGNAMNSFKDILETFGSSTPTPPMVSAQTPMEGETVQPMFPIKIAISDDIAVTKAELRIDGMLISTLTGQQQVGGVFIWNAPASVGQGRHKITVTGYDIAGTPAQLDINVTLGMACSKPADCDKDTDTCVDGRCVAGSGVDGGLGTSCATGTECASGQCASDAAGEMHCVEMCTPSADGCPSSFDCLPTAGDMGVCWPGGDDGGGCSTGGNDAAPGLLLLGVVGLLATRRRRR